MKILKICFNPAEAEEGFRRSNRIVSILEYNNSFNPAEAEEGFRRGACMPPLSKVGLRFNPAEAEEGFRRTILITTLFLRLSFNPAEAEEGFRSKTSGSGFMEIETVSIQPKPKKGLEEPILHPSQSYRLNRFNPAEAEEGFRR